MKRGDTQSRQETRSNPWPSDLSHTAPEELVRVTRVPAAAQRSSGSSSTTEAIMMRAEALPIVPARSDSA